MEVTATSTFKRRFKKATNKVQVAIEAAVDEIATNPLQGEIKKGDLSGFRVFKFKYGYNQLLIAYIYRVPKQIELIDFGSHENFYRDLKRRLK